MTRKVYLLFVYLPEFVEGTSWLLIDRVFFSDHAARDHARELWAEKKTRIRAVMVEEPQR